MIKTIYKSNLQLLIIFLIIVFYLTFVSAANDPCTDSDTGQNFDEKGTVIDKTDRSETDYCTSSSKLVEWYCNPYDNAVYIYHTCTCEDGACVTVTPTPSVTIPTPNVTAPPTPTTEDCIDSDGGQNFDEKGIVVDKTDRSETDYCTSSSKLVEWDCSSSGHATYKYHTCTCKDGTCVTVAPTNVTVPSPNLTTPIPNLTITPPIIDICTDSDTGQNFDEKGTVVDKIDRSETDYCTSSSKLVEWYCNPYDNAVYIYHTCTCEDGACVTVTPTNVTVPSPNVTAPPTSTVACTDSSILGDIDNNGKVTYDDYLTIYSIATGSIQPPTNVCCVDLNKDNQITLDDTQLAYDVYVGKVNFGRCGEIGCIIGEPCTTPENCPGKYDNDCNCVDIPNDNCPIIVSDTDPSTISDVSVTPEVGAPGTIFTIKAKVEDESALQYVLTRIYVLNNDDDSVRLDMYDDGHHNDEQANDGIYGAVWDSTGYGEGMYGYYITTRDIYNNDASNRRSYFVISETTDLCKEVIPGHNNIDEPRANIVFVGINYPDKEFFKNIVEEGVDYDGNKQGLLFLEPLKSNKEKFNFWYVDETKDLGFNHWDDIYASLNKRIGLSLMCPLSNKYLIAFYNTFFRPQAFYKDHAQISFLDVDCSFRQYCSNVDLDGDGCVSGRDYFDYSGMTFAKDFKDKSVPDVNEDGDISGDDLEITFLCQQYRVGCPNEYTDCLRRDHFDDHKTYIAHEFGHLFGGLLDEYVEEGVSPYSISYNGNCFEGAKNECLSNLNEKWYDLLGYGCGDDNKIDCVKEPNCQSDANEDGRVTRADADMVYDIYVGKVPITTCISDGQEFVIGDIDNDGEVEYEDYISVSNVARLGVVCNDPNDPGCYLEVGCFEGCNYQATGWFRNAVSNIMKNNFVGPEYFSYGPVNERVICEELKSVTGSATGICSTKYDIR